MALSLDDPLLWGVVFVLVFVVEVLVVMNMKGDAGKGRYERRSQDAVLAEGEELTDVLSRFVEDQQGDRIGETVGMDGDLVIVKASDQAAYKAIPRKHLVRSGETFKVQGVVSWGEAERLGAEWKERQHRVVEYQADELPEDERP